MKSVAMMNERMAKTRSLFQKDVSKWLEKAGEKNSGVKDNVQRPGSASWVGDGACQVLRVSQGWKGM